MPPSVVASIPAVTEFVLRSPAEIVGPALLAVVEREGRGQAAPTGGALRRMLL
jgi:hypothetical protein